MDKCMVGFHEFVTVITRQDTYEELIVRWCPVCGSIQVDQKVGGLVYPGRGVPLRTPYAAELHGVR